MSPLPAWLQTLRRAPRQRLRSPSKQQSGGKQHLQATALPLAPAMERTLQLMPLTERGPLLTPATRRRPLQPLLAAAAPERRRGRLLSITLASPVTGLAAS